jgi:uncharacterized protein YjiS (DUF1127 family)
MRAASLMRLRRLMRRLQRLLAAHRDMRLLRADERVLRDVGLTRGDAQAAAACTYMARAAALRRNEAMRVARLRNGCAGIGAAPSPRMQGGAATRARPACYDAASG